MTTVPEEGFAAALASLPGAGPRTLRRWLDAGEPSSWWRRLTERGSDPRWAEVARLVDPARVWASHRHHGVAVTLRGRPGYPVRLAGDEEAPAVLFSLGDPTVLDRRPVVAVVGTRTATRYGLGMAAQLGTDLAATGVTVLSGLALGIDGAAHEGAAAAWESGRATGRAPAGPPVAVVAGGLDHPYPRRHALLWRRVAAAGAILSEAPLGAADLGWRFPLRNRIIAALADAVVVVECHVTGGSLHTVRAAAHRGVAVGAVPGSVRSPASAGTNDLLADGCFVVRDVADVLVAVGLARAGEPPGTAAGAPAAPAAGAPATPAAPAAGAPATGEPVADPVTDPIARRVLAVLDWDPCPMEEVLAQTGLRLDQAATALEALRAAGWARGSGGWWERASS